ncbi:TonB-dependent receptor [Flavobacterium sp. xlx-214]|uniref:TonB-dependent receptor domain-containing protein n=1 Tax=unclassified Flavobacterium TaxID=196869 RepID=UPI0013D1AACE|nr:MULTISPECIES: TonB-dependent receptor [unclassified Flavobacterium]MBA5791749.1 TonB-dependent receptor [Flavobacterium sp. xlx-221]QMI82988.1 TonB-dependent receptor [Flavobacterium sp. xlx-214]
MKTILHFLIALGFLCTSSLFAQTYEVKALVKTNNEPATFYDVLLIGKDTLTSNTDANGYFAINAQTDTYRLEILYFDTVVYEQNLTVNNSIDLGIITLNDETELSEVVIETAKKLTERKADRFVYYVENATASAGGTALDALKTTPGVTITQESIGVTGKNSVMVLIDDKPTYMNQSELMHYLESISANNLSKIEVITTPPAKYQAEGNSGIINIVTKQVKKNSWNATLGGAYQRSRRNTQQYITAFNLQKNKVTLKTSINTGLRRSLINWNNDIYYPDAFWQNENYSDAKNRNISGQLALDYQLTKKWTIGTKLSTYVSKFTDVQPQVTTIFDVKGGNIQQYLKNNATSNHKTYQQIYNLYTEYKLDTLGKKITFDVDYVNYHTPNFNNYTYAKYTPSDEIIANTTHGGINDVAIKIKNLSAKLDAELPTPFADFTAGARFSKSKSNNLLRAFSQNENGEMTYDTNLSNYFEYTENNEALYVSASKKLNEKWSFQAGLRLEATQTEGYSRETNNLHKNDYLKLFPTLYALHQFTDNKSLGFNYSRRIRRPSYESLNPFRTINNEFSYNEGNPFLKPSFTHNFELTFTYKTFDTRIHLSKMDDGVNQASMLNAETKQNNYIWMNYVDEQSIGLTQSYTVKPKAWWTSVNTLYAGYSESNIAISTQKYKGVSGSFYTTNDFTLNGNKTLFLSVSYFQNFGETFQNTKLKPYAKFYATVKYLMLDKKLELGISGTDIFNGREYITQEMYGVSQQFKNIWDMQRVRFSLTYRFGNNHLKTNERQSGNSEELNRM